MYAFDEDDLRELDEERPDDPAQVRNWRVGVLSAAQRSVDKLVAYLKDEFCYTAAMARST